jgi:hypothetical protein
MRVMLRNLGVALATCILTACAAFGVPSISGFNAKLAGGYTTVTTVRELGSILLASKVTAANMVGEDSKRKDLLAAAKMDAQNIQDQADKAKEGLDVARRLKEVDFKSAEARLESTLTILKALEAYTRGEVK